MLLSNEQRQKLAVEALRRSEERFRDIAEAASDWVWEMGADLRFSYVSAALRRAHGHRAQEASSASARASWGGW